MRFEFDESDLAAQTWPENEATLDRADFVVLPTGSTEQHSTHLPTFTDSIRAAELSRALAEAAPKHDLELAVLPPLPYGESAHHLPFPGTITLAPDTYQEVVVDIGASLAAHDTSRLLLMNCHGGNREPLALAANRIEREHDLQTHFVHWTDFARERLQDAFGEGWGHAGDHETSVIELFYPDLVDHDAAEPQSTTDRPETRNPPSFDELTEQGGLGDPTAADAAAVESIIEAATEDILEALATDIGREP
jgi:creatinine amidohydrolase